MRLDRLRSVRSEPEKAHLELCERLAGTLNDQLIAPVNPPVRTTTKSTGSRGDPMDLLSSS